MARNLPVGLREVLKSSYAESHSTLELSLPSDIAPAINLYFATARLTIDGVVYDRQLRNAEAVKTSLTRATDRVTVELQNVDTILGVDLLAVSDTLYGANVQFGRYWKDLDSKATFHHIMLTGAVADVEINENVARLTIISDTYAAVSVGAKEQVIRTCRFQVQGEFRGTACGYSGAKLTCNGLIDDADGCEGRHGTPLKRAKFGGFVYIESQASVAGAVALPIPASNQLIKLADSSGTVSTTNKQQPFIALHEDGYNLTNDDTNLQVRVSPKYSVQAINVVFDYNADSTGATSSATAINNAVTAALAQGRPLYFPTGTYLGANLTGITYQLKIFGDGPERTILKAAAANTPVIEISNASSHTIQISDLTIEGYGASSGSTGYGIYVHDQSDGLYNFFLNNVWVKNCGGDGVRIRGQFTNKFESVFVTNCGGNAFDISGGNTILLDSCYVDDVADGKCGYRIRAGQAILLNCNGLDTLGTTSDWAIVGQAIADGDPADSYCEVQLIGCNVEAFKRYGVWAKVGSHIDCKATIFTTSASGFAHVAIKTDYTNNQVGTFDGLCRFNLQGTATWANSMPIHSNSDIPIMALGRTDQTQYYSDAAATARSLPSVGVTAISTVPHVYIPKLAPDTILFPTDNAGDIGATGANRPRDLFLGRNLAVGGTTALASTATQSASVAGFLGWTVTNSNSGGQAGLYAVNHSGKNAFIQVFQDATGIAQVGSDHFPVYVKASGNNNWYFDTALLSPLQDNTSDLGAGSTRIKDAFLAGSLNLKERTSPGTPAANSVVLYAKDKAGTSALYFKNDAGTETEVGSGGGGGTVTSVSVVSANGFAGSVANATTTPAITLTTSITGLLKGNGTAISAASAGTDYEVPITFSTGLTRTVNTITVNTTQNIAKLSNLTSNGFVKTSGGDGTLSVDTSTYLTSNQAITLSSEVTGSGATSITTTINKAIAPTWTGLHTFNPGTTSQSVLSLETAAMTGVGSRDSHFATFKGRAHDGVAHTAEWRIFAATQSNSGGSSFAFQNRIDAAAFANMLLITDQGELQSTAVTSDFITSNGSVIGLDIDSTNGYTVNGGATSGTILRGNGTVYVASSFTMAAPGTSGNVLTSNGTNWVSSAPSGGGGTPGGSTTQLQYNNAGAFGGITGATTNGTVVTLTSPVLVTPAIGTPSSGVLTNATGLPISTGLTGAGTGVLTALGVNTGSAGAVVLFNGAGGTPSSMTATNLSGTAASLTAGAATILATARTINGTSFDGSANITITVPVATGISGLGTGVATALAVNVGSAGAFVTFNGALGTPSSGVATNLTGTAPGLTAGTVTTNANLTGNVTSVGNATTIAAGVVTNAMLAGSIDLTAKVTGNLPVTNGGTGRATGATAFGLLAAGATATGAHQTLAAGLTTEILVGGGTSALPAWTTATGSGAPVRATSPTLVTPLLGTPTSGTLTNCTGLPISGGLATIATLSILGRITASTGNVETLTQAQATTLVQPVGFMFGMGAEWVSTTQVKIKSGYCYIESLGYCIYSSTDLTATIPTTASAFSDLASTITSSGNIPLTSSSGYPTSGRGQIDSEQFDWTSISGNSLVVSARGVNGTTAAAHTAGARVTYGRWLYVYMYLSGSTPTLEITTTAPAAAFAGNARSKTSDPSRRWVFSMKTYTDNTLFNFNHDPNKGLVQYKLISSLYPFRILTTGTANGGGPVGAGSGTLTTVEGSIVFPPQSLTGLIRLFNYGNGTALSNLYIGAPGQALGIGGAGQYFAVNPGTESITDVFLSSSQQTAYIYDAAPSGVAGSGAYFDVLGYYLSRS